MLHNSFLWGSNEFVDLILKIYRYVKVTSTFLKCIQRKKNQIDFTITIQHILNINLIFKY
jgi:hypothetical protein